MEWKELEDWFEEKLKAAKISYDREGVRINYGHSSSKGKHDFKLDDCWLLAVELKHTNSLNKVSFPRPGYRSSFLKAHQMKALASYNAPDRVGYLIFDEESKSLYFMSLKKFHRIIERYGLVSSLKHYIDDCVVNMDEFVNSLADKEYRM